MNPRERILARVREALAVPTEASVRALAGNRPVDAEAAREFMPPGGESLEERLKWFVTHAENLKVEVRQVADTAAAADVLRELAQTGGWRAIASHHHALTDEVVGSLKMDTLWTDDEPGVDRLEACEAGVTVCEALIAQSGSILVTSRGCGGRALSVLPHHHVVLARREQLLPDLWAGFALLRERYREVLPSFISFITGASRTGDIERILVLGAHGPKRLTVILLADAAPETENPTHA